MADRPESFHCVAQGECMLTIAQNYGIRDWRTIYEHAENADLRQVRPSPHVLQPGDLVYIPAGIIPSSSVQARQTHRFRGTVARASVVVRLRDQDGQPLRNVPYELEALDEVLEGTTTGDGEVRQRVDLRAREAALRLFEDGRDQPPRVVRLNIGHLDPEGTDGGVRGRLVNLGYGHGHPDAADALRSFQADHDLDAHGEADSATVGRLRDVYDGR